MSIPNLLKRKLYVSLLKGLKKSLVEEYWHRFAGERSKGVVFYERSHLGISYLISETFYPRQSKPFFSSTIIIQIPYSEVSSINSSIQEAFERSVFGRPVKEVEGRVAEELCYDTGLAGETMIGDYEPKEKVQFPFFEDLESIEEADSLAKEFIELYKKRSEDSIKRFEVMVKELMKMENLTQKV